MKKYVVEVPSHRDKYRTDRPYIILTRGMSGEIYMELYTEEVWKNIPLCVKLTKKEIKTYYPMAREHFTIVEVD